MSTGVSGVRSSCESVARNSSFARLARSASACAVFSAWMSVLVPNHLAIAPGVIAHGLGAHQEPAIFAITRLSSGIPLRSGAPEASECLPGSLRRGHIVFVNILRPSVAEHVALKIVRAEVLGAFLIGKIQLRHSTRAVQT